MLNRALVGVVAVLLSLSTFPAFAQTTSGQLTGTLAYHERMALPGDAVINVKLLDTSIADIASQTVADVMINAEGRQVPIPFTMSFDPALVVSGHHYSVRATIRSSDGMLLFSTTQAYPVLTHGAPSKVNLILHTVGHGTKPGAASKKPAESAKAETQSPTPTSDSGASAPAAPPSEAAPSTGAEINGEKQEGTLPASPSSASDSPNGNAEQQIVIKPQAAPSTEVTVPGSAPEPSSRTAPSASESSNPVQANDAGAKPTESVPASSSAAAPAETAPPAQTPATPAAAAVPNDSKAAEVPPPSEHVTPLDSAGQPSASPEAKSAEPEAPLPEAPSTTKRAELAAAAPEPAGNSPEPEGESTSRPERLAPPKADTPLADTQWKLVQLAGVDVLITPPQKPLTIAFSPEGRRIAGSAGCNSYLGTFTDENGHLQLHPGNMTMIVCADPAGSREHKFVAMLRAADGYKISGDLLLLTSNGKIVAKFKNNQ